MFSREWFLWHDSLFFSTKSYDVVIRANHLHAIFCSGMVDIHDDDGVEASCF